MIFLFWETKSKGLKSTGQIETHLQLSTCGILQNCWEQKHTTPNTQLHSRLNWKRNQTSGFGLETGARLPSGIAPPPRDVDKEVGEPEDVSVRVRHVTQQTCLPECAKQFST